MKRFLCLFLAVVLALSLAGCNDPQETAPSESASPAPSDDATPSPEETANFLPDNETDATLDILGFPNSTALLTVNGQEVTAEEYLYWLGNMTAYYQSLYASYYGGALDLSEEVEDGVTWDDQLKEIAYQNAVLLALVPDLAEEYGVSLSEDEMDDLVQEHDDDVASVGEDVYAYRLQAMNVNDETAFWMDVESALFNKVQEAWQEKTASELTDEEVDAYVEEKDLLRAKHILLLTKDMTTGEDYDEEKRDEQRAKAEDILERIQAGEDFDTLMNENSEDSGLSAYPDGYLFSAGEMVTEFEEGTRALEIGAVSPELVESAYGYHIILRMDPDCQETRDDLLEDKFNEMVQQRVDGAAVVKAPEYDGFTAAEYYDKLTAFQDTLTDPSASETTSEGSSAEP